jgi:hypothetical protein
MPAGEQMRIMSLTRAVMAVLVGSGVAATAAAAAQAQPHVAVVTCSNTASGTTWQIRIDYRRATVDSYPARIGASAISWHDAKDGGTYTLNRKTGALTFVAPSSTGGYFLHHQCRLP